MYSPEVFGRTAASTLAVRGLGFDIGSEGPLDWRNRRASYGQDDPGETTAILLPSLLERLPIVSKTLAVCALNPEAATLTREGLVFPLVVYLSEPDAEAPCDGPCHPSRCPGQPYVVANCTKSHARGCGMRGALGRHGCTLGWR